MVVLADPMNLPESHSQDLNHFYSRETNAYRGLTDLRVRYSMPIARLAVSLNDSHNQILCILAPNSTMDKENLHHFRAHYPQ